MGFAADDPMLGIHLARPEFAGHARPEFSTFTWPLQPILANADLEVVDEEIRSRISRPAPAARWTQLRANKPGDVEWSERSERTVRPKGSPRQGSVDAADRIRTRIQLPVRGRANRGPVLLRVCQLRLPEPR